MERKPNSLTKACGTLELLGLMKPFGVMKPLELLVPLKLLPKFAWFVRLKAWNMVFRLAFSPNLH